MIKRIAAYTGLLVFSMPVFSAAQFYDRRPEFLNANAVWTFGDGAGYDFRTHQPLNVPFSSLEGSCGRCSSDDGSPLLFNNGAGMFNRDFSIMMNTGGVIANGSVTQVSVTVPVLSSPDLHYVFTLNSGDNFSPSLYYHIVDMRLGGGKGDIIAGRKNLVLDTGYLSEAMIAVPGDDCDIWLLVHAFEEPVFKAYHITSAGIDPNPVISGTGLAIHGFRSYGMGAMAVSPDRTMLALAVGADPANSPVSAFGLLTARFDPATGIVSDAVRISDGAHYGVCFSPDNSRLYATLNNDRGTGSGGLYQYTVNSFDSATMVTSRFEILHGLRGGSGLKKYNDTIYIAENGGSYLHRINNPNAQGAGCDHELDAVPLMPGKRTTFGLPNDAVLPLPADTIYHSTYILYCADKDSLTLVAPENNSWVAAWNEPGHTDKELKVGRAGTYWVITRNYCGVRVDSFHVVYHHFAPGDVLGNDTLICSADVLKLDPGLENVQYGWSDGSSGPSLNVSASGLYWVHMSREGCTASDSIFVQYAAGIPALPRDRTVCREAREPIVLSGPSGTGFSIAWSTGEAGEHIIANDSGIYWLTVRQEECLFSDTFRLSYEKCDCDYFVPSAFSPNGDGRNDRFRVQFEAECRILNFRLTIFDRWGRVIFQTTDPSGSWDGMSDGTPSDLGIYMYHLHFESGSSLKPYSVTGDVMLVR